MLKKRIIPKLLLMPSKNSKQLISGTSKKYDSLRPTGLAESQAQIYQSSISDELMVLVTSKTSLSISEIKQILSKINSRVLMPVSFGGGIDSLEAATSIFETGIEKVVFNRAQYSNPNLIRQVVQKYGQQAVVISVDYYETNNNQEVYVKMIDKFTRVNLSATIKSVEELGAGEICLNNVSRDGMLNGTDLVTLQSVRNYTNLPIVQSCGVGKISHFIDAFHNGADAVAAGTFFSFLDQSILQVRSHVKNSGIDIRS
jgi:cyclase